MLMPMISLGEVIRVQESILLRVSCILEKKTPTRSSELFSDDVGNPVWNFDRWEVQDSHQQKITDAEIDR
jgi:hypothetical protein